MWRAHPSRVRERSVPRSERRAVSRGGVVRVTTGVARLIVIVLRRKVDGQLFRVEILEEDITKQPYFRRPTDADDSASYVVTRLNPKRGIRNSPNSKKAKARRERDAMDPNENWPDGDCDVCKLYRSTPNSLDVPLMSAEAE